MASGRVPPHGPIMRRSSFHPDSTAGSGDISLVASVQVDWAQQGKMSVLVMQLSQHQRATRCELPTGCQGAWGGDCEGTWARSKGHPPPFLCLKANNLRFLLFRVSLVLQALLAPLGLLACRCVSGRVGAPLDGYREGWE
jgi:hypothetical protein